MPMTVLMKAWYRRLPPSEQYALPPQQITDEAAKKVGLDQTLDEPEEKALAALAAHFGYGTAAGVAYATLAGSTPLPPAVKGGLFGLGLWTISYLGLMPGLGLLSPATRHPARRNLLMITANVVWGATTATLLESLHPDDAGR